MDPKLTDTAMRSGNPITVDAPDEALLRSVIKLSRTVLGITMGVLCGLGIFFATNILVLKGGQNMGVHLQLLGQFFPGYSVSVAGSLVGLTYGFFVGYIGGWIVATVYNWVVLLRNGPSA